MGNSSLRSLGKYKNPFTKLLMAIIAILVMVPYEFAEFLSGKVYKGIAGIFRGFLGHAESLPPERRERRTCFLRRLVTAWCACYVTVTPVMVYTLWHTLAAITA